MSQEKALELLKSGSNVFLTGAAGTGKTYVLSQFIQYLKDNNIYCGITASTGIAATQFNGVTIHSWSGIGIKDKISKEDLINLKRSIIMNYTLAKVLIIDEISMLHAHQLNMIDSIARHILDKDKPFGGLQVVLCGDFCQLPPVANNDETIVFAYESKAWLDGNFKVCYLQAQYRQNDDDCLLTVLNAIRSGKPNNNIKNILNNFTDIKVEQATKLYTTNIDVDLINRFALRKLKGKSHIFKMSTYGDEYNINILKNRCLAKEVIELKVGALVIFIQNDRDKRYVNGTLGTVTGFTKYGAPIVITKDNTVIYVTESDWKIEDIEGNELASIRQIPVCLAWAITIHKSQGMTIDSAKIDLRKAFCYGMGYVALSRIKDSSGLQLIGYNDIALRIDPKMLEQDLIFKEVSIL